MSTPAPNTLVGIVGGSGAGKSWLVGRLCRALGDQACHLALDDFYRDRSHLPPARRARLNFDAPAAIDWTDAVRVLQDCRDGRPTAVPRYDFATYSRIDRLGTWSPRPVVLVEGLWLLRSPELRRLFDLKIFLDAPPPLRESRRLARDTVERGYSAESVRDRLAACVVPMHARYVEPQRRWADLVLTQPFREAGIRELADRLWDHLAERRLKPGWGRETFRVEIQSLLVDHEYAC